MILLGHIAPAAAAIRIRLISAALADLLHELIKSSDGRRANSSIVRSSSRSAISLISLGSTAPTSFSRCSCNGLRASAKRTLVSRNSSSIHFPLHRLGCATPIVAEGAAGARRKHAPASVLEGAR